MLLVGSFMLTCSATGWMSPSGSTLAGCRARTILSHVGPELTPLQVITAQLSALQRGAEGIADAFTHVSPTNGKRDGEDAMERFEAILRNIYFESLLQCTRFDVFDTAELSDECFVASVRVVPAPVPGCVAMAHMPVFYRFQLSRQTTAPYTGCWMLEQMSPERPPIEADCLSDAPPVLPPSPPLRASPRGTPDVQMCLNTCMTSSRNADAAPTRAGRRVLVLLGAHALLTRRAPPAQAGNPLFDACSMLDDRAEVRHAAGGSHAFDVTIAPPGFDNWCTVEVRALAADQPHHGGDELGRVEYLWLKDASTSMTRRVYAARKLKPTDEPTAAVLRQQLKVGYRVKPLLYCSLHGLYEGEPFTVS